MRLRATKAIVWELAFLACFSASCSKSNDGERKVNVNQLPQPTTNAAVRAVAKGPPTPTEPAVMSTTLTLPDGGTCNATIDGDCVACIRKNGSPELPESCDKLTGKAKAGPAAGLPRAQLCHEALDCMRRTTCHANGLIDCYCGKITLGECNATVNAGGACKKEIERALEIAPGSTGSSALSIITEPEVAGGVAGLIATAENTGCPGVCLPYQATSCR
jgi:hypothetical protein